MQAALLAALTFTPMSCPLSTTCSWKARIEEAQAAQDSIASFRAVFKYGNPNTVVKKAAALLGNPVGECRRPFSYLSEEGALRPCARCWKRTRQRAWPDLKTGGNKDGASYRWYFYGRPLWQWTGDHREGAERSGGLQDLQAAGGGGIALAWNMHWPCPKRSTAST